MSSLFLYPLKTSENLWFLCFQGVKKETRDMKRFKWQLMNVSLIRKTISFGPSIKHLSGPNYAELAARKACLVLGYLKLFVFLKYLIKIVFIKVELLVRHLNIMLIVSTELYNYYLNIGERLILIERYFRIRYRCEYCIWNHEKNCL